METTQLAARTCVTGALCLGGITIEEMNHIVSLIAQTSSAILGVWWIAQGCYKAYKNYKAGKSVLDKETTPVDLK